MPGDAVQRLVEEGQRSGLFASAAARDQIAQLTADPTVTPDEAAARLVESRILTPYQAEQLLAGRGDACLIAGRYRVEEKLGAGGMGTVYRAHDTTLHRPVALKLLPAQLVNDPGAVARFRREALALAQVSHPGIVQAYDAGEDRGQPFLAMEYVAGTSLAQLLKDEGRVPPTLAADFIHQAAEALQHAHEKGVVHRDVKPANLLLTPDRQVKVLDLGLARFLQDQLGDAGLTREGTGMGTPDYMAPEQFQDARRADARSDVYALGCTLYHLLGGRVPFPGSSLSEKAEAHERREPPALDESCPEAPAGLVLVVRRAMAKSPGGRFQTARELADALAPYVATASRTAAEFKTTAVWHRGRLTMRASGPGRRAVRWAAGLVAAAALIALAAYIGPRRWRPAENVPDSGPSPAAAPAAPAVVTIPNGVTVAKDGTGQFTTLAAALEKASPGMTVRVLDDAVYTESVFIAKPKQHEGITLEAVRGATVRVPAETKLGIVVVNVPYVTVRGFTVRTDETGKTCLAVGYHSPGAVVERVRLVSKNPVRTTGVTLDSLQSAERDEPVRVRNCTITGLGNGFEVIGLNLQSQAPSPCRRVILRDNVIENGAVGVWVLGHVRDMQVTGNRLRGCSEAGIRLAGLFKGGGRVLIANNTVQGSHHCVEVTQAADGIDDVEVRNNLLVADLAPDMARIDGGQGPPAGWRIDHNWLQVPRPTPGSVEARQSLESPLDTVTDRLPGVPTDPAGPAFLRPFASSPLATAGAGAQDPSLPRYVGALPPPGTEPWDWDRTWKLRAAK